MDKAELLARTQAGWDDLNTYVQTLNDGQLTQLTDAAGWTVKDHLMHLAIWEDGVWALLNKQNRAGQMGIDAATWARWNFDEINAVIQQQYKDATWAEVEQKRHAIHDRFVAQIAAMSDADLQRPYRYYYPQSTNENAIYHTIIGDTYEHFVDHKQWIEAIVNQI